MESLSEKPTIWSLTGWILLAILVGITFLAAWFFPYAYDDAYIAFRISENFVQTGSPTFAANQPIFTNTSLLYPLWNSIWIRFLGEGWVHKVPIINACLQVLILLRIAILFRKTAKNQTSWFWALLGITPIALSSTQLSVGNSGLETSLYQVFLVFGLLPGSFALIAWLSGLVRPEGFLSGVAVSINQFLDFGFKKSAISQLPKVAFAIGLYLILGWYWFGTLIPQSILAKSNYEIDRWQQIQNGLQYLFMQGYGWYALLIGATWVQFNDIRKEFRPLLIWCAGYTLFFSILASWWAWYVPPLLVPIAYMTGRSVQCWYGHFAELKSWKWPLGVGLVLALCIVEISSAYQRLSSQSAAFAIRETSSQKIGQWLSKNVKSNQQVLLEPLGLISYYSPNTRFLDYPGLSNPKMSNFIHQLNRKIPIQMVDIQTDSAIISHFKPNLVLLFPYEVPVFQSIENFNAQYQKLDSLSYYPNHERFRQVVIFELIPKN